MKERMSDSVLLLIGHVIVNCAGVFGSFYHFYLKEICINDNFLLINLHGLSEVIMFF